MEKNTGYRYIVEGNEELDEFAKSVLILVNIKSNGGWVKCIKTVVGTNNLLITTDVEQSSYLSRIIGNIKSVEEIDIWTLDYTDLHRKSVNQLDIIEKDYLDNNKYFHIISKVIGVPVS